MARVDLTYTLRIDVQTLTRRQKCTRARFTASWLVHVSDDEYTLVYYASLSLFSSAFARGAAGLGGVRACAAR